MGNSVLSKRKADQFSHRELALQGIAAVEQATIRDARIPFRSTLVIDAQNLKEFIISVSSRKWWADKELAAVLRAPRLFAVGWHPGPAEIDISLANYQVRFTPDGKRLSVAGYIMKQMTHRAWFKRGLIRKAGGPILGKRGGCTRNIGWEAREAFWLASERPSALSSDRPDVGSRKDAA